MGALQIAPRSRLVENGSVWAAPLEQAVAVARKTLSGVFPLGQTKILFQMEFS